MNASMMQELNAENLPPSQEPNWQPMRHTQLPSWEG